jgi:hypothetical protein
MIRRCLIVVAALATLAGCAYTTETSLDPKYMTVYVSPFHDESKEYDLQAPLTNAVTRKFITDSRLKVVPKEDADLLIEGVIMDYRMRGLTSDQNDDPTQFLLVITAGVRCTDQDTGDVLWEEELMAGETTYYTRAAGQSSDRLRGNAEVFLPTVRSFASEEENRAASEALEQLASDIFYRTIEPW